MDGVGGSSNSNIILQSIVEQQCLCVGPQHAAVNCQKMLPLVLRPQTLRPWSRSGSQYCPGGSSPPRQCKTRSASAAPATKAMRNSHYLRSRQLNAAEDLAFRTPPGASA